MRFLLSLLLLAGCAPAEAPASEVITVKATAIALNSKDPAQQTVGRLRYMGGLVLRSDDKRFGGISGLRWIAYRQSSDGKSALAVRLASDWEGPVIFIATAEARDDGELAARIADGGIAVPPIQTFAFEDVAAALELQATRHVCGKVAVLIS